MKSRFALGVLAYIVPTFALGFVWHLILFKQYYEDLAIYRKDIIIPFGFLSMLIQAVLFAWGTLWTGRDIGGQIAQPPHPKCCQSSVTKAFTKQYRLHPVCHRLARHRLAQARIQPDGGHTIPNIPGAAALRINHRQLAARCSPEVGIRGRRLRSAQCRPGCRDSPRKGRQATRDGEQLPASRLHFYTLYFFQEIVVFVNNGALKSTLAPAQRIAGIISYWGMEMLFPALVDEFNHIIDGHSNLLSDVDAAATV